MNTMQDNESLAMDIWHLMLEEASDEVALCKPNLKGGDLIGVQSYMEDRLNGLSVPTVCNECKDAAARWGCARRSELDAEGLGDEAYEYGQFAAQLAKEVGMDG